MSTKARGLKPEEDGPVVFELPDGGTVSNSSDTGLEAFKAQMADQAAARGAVDQTSNDDELPNEPGEGLRASQQANRGAAPEDYHKLDGKELKALAKTREIDITGVKKKSELIERLEADDRSRRQFEFTGRDIQGDFSPSDDQAEVARREAEAATVSTDGSDVEAAGLSNDSEQDELDDDNEDDEE